MDLENSNWYVKRIDDPRFQKVVNYVIEKSGKDEYFWTRWELYGRDDSDIYLNGYQGCDSISYGFPNAKEITLDEFIEYSEPFVLPERWCIKLDFQEAVDYANKYGKGESAGQYIIDTLMYAHFPNFFHGYCVDNRVHKGYELITKEQFFKHVMKQEFILPEKYFITKIDHPDYKLICDYFHDKSCSVTNNWSDFNYLYYEKNNNLKGYNACYDTYKIKNCTEVSVEDFVKHVLNKETKMEQKLTRKQLITLYNADSCSKWKEIISQYVTTFSAFATDDVTTFIDPTHLDLLFKEGTDKQKKLVTDLGIVLKEDKNAFVKEFKYDETRIISSKLFGNDNVLLICQNSQDRINRPDLRGRAFVVSKDYTVKTYSSEGNDTIIEIVKK